MKSKPFAYDAYQEIAEAYAAKIDQKPHNAYYERPAVLSLLPDVEGREVLDAGCGPGVLTALLLERGASGVLACDASERMLDFARERLADLPGSERVELVQLDLALPLSGIASERFDLVVASLCLDYVEDWRALFSEFRRVLAPGGHLVFSCGHPAFEAEYFKTDRYFEVEAVSCTWSGFGKKVEMPSYRRSFQEVVMPVLESGFVLEQVIEPRPTAEFAEADPERFARLEHRPSFLCVRARRARRGDGHDG